MDRCIVRLCHNQVAMKISGMKGHFFRLPLILLFLVTIIGGCQTPEAVEPEAVFRPLVRVPKPDDIRATKIPEDAIWLENKDYFKTLYSSLKKIAYYSTYTLKGENLKKPQRGVRRDNYQGDKRLKERHLLVVGSKWYEKSDYERGHLAPAEDFDWDQEAIDSTFLMSNMVPEKRDLNQRALKGLEAAVRGWACTEKKLQVITGPILEKGLASFDSHPIPIPNQIFKVVLDLTPPAKAIAFIFEQNDNDHSAYKSRVVTVRKVEAATGLSLSDEIPSPHRESVVSHSDLSAWKGSECRTKTVETEGIGDARKGL